MIARVVRNAFTRTLSFSLLLAATAGAAMAQTTTGTIRGHVRGAGGMPLVGTIVAARNTDLNQERATNTNDLGFYNLSGLRPGPYQLTARRLGMAPQTRSVRVQIGQTLDIDFTLSDTAVTLAAVQVIAEQVTETKSSEIATNVTQEQINDLPSAERNFLNLAVLAPGTQLRNDRLNAVGKTLTAGAQNAEQINVFIDGATYKNDILQGGVVGQDASRGNPFPRNAVQEFRVITQNYKAEYQKASSAIITATTKTGGPNWEGSAFFNILNKDLVALDSFQRASKNAPGSTFQKPDFERYQFGASGGGPLAQNLRVFGSVELNRQNRAARVNITPPDSVALDTIDFASRNGLFDQPFRAVLGFAKLTYLHTPSSTFDFSYNLRTENDERDFGAPGNDLQRAYETGVRFNNDVNTAVLKHTYAGGMFLNEAMGSYQKYHYNPTPIQAGPVNRFYGFCNSGGCPQIGSNTTVQDFTQQRISLRNDLTYSGIQAGGSHVFKVGGNVDFAKYDVIKRNSEIPRFVYEPWHYGFRIPQRVEFESGDPNFSDDNTQLGLYLQDDWNPTSRLVLNLGVRWDYESKMMNYDYVTPRSIVDSLRKYEDRLFLPLDESRYFTDGTQRDKFYGAFQPRVGFAYGIGAEQRTTLFGAWGLFYDRTLYDFTLEERFAQQHPRYNIQIVPADSTPGPNQIRYDPALLEEGKPAVEAAAAAIGALNPEVKLLPNDLRPPRSTQWTLGVRQAIGTFLVEAAYSNVRSKNQLTFYWADANFTCPQRSFRIPGCFQENSIPGFSTILFADNAGKTWYDAIQIKVDRFYRRSSENFGWGGGIAWTIAERQTEGFNDLFSFPNPADYPKQKRNDERHRVVANWILDVPYAWGIQFSGLLTVGSGTRADVGDRFACVGPDTATCQRNFVPGGFDPPTFKTLDLRFRKDFARFGGSRMGVTLDLFNVFNWQNLGCFNTDPQSDNFGKGGCVISDPRRLQIGAEFDFARPQR